MYVCTRGFLWGGIEARKLEYPHPGTMPELSAELFSVCFILRLEVTERGKAHFADVEMEAQRRARDFSSRAALMVKEGEGASALALGIDHGPWHGPFPSDF